MCRGHREPNKPADTEQKQAFVSNSLVYLICPAKYKYVCLPKPPQLL